MAYIDGFNGYDGERLYSDMFIAQSYTFNPSTGYYELSDWIGRTDVKVGSVYYYYTNGWLPVVSGTDPPTRVTRIYQMRITRNHSIGPITTVSGERGTRSSSYSATPIDNAVIAGHGERNVIDKDNVALERDFIFGYDYGVINGFNATVNAGTQGNNAVTLDGGQLFAYGYVAELSKPVTFDYLLPSVEQYWVIYGEIDMSRVPNEFNIKTKNNGSSQNVEEPSRWRQDVLSSVRTGVFQMPLWRVKLTSSAIELTDIKPARPAIGNVMYADTAKVCTGSISDATYSYYIDSFSGVTFYDIPLGYGDVYKQYSFDKTTGKYSPVGAMYNEQSLNVNDKCYWLDDSMPQYMQEGTVYLNSEGELVVQGGDHSAVLVTAHEQAVTQPSTDKSTKVATTEFVHNVIKF